MSKLGEKLIAAARSATAVNNNGQPSASWDAYHIGLAQHVATKSKDRSTKVGCVIVGPDNETLTTGFNGFPRGVNDDVEERHERPLKYRFAAHAEANAIFTAARHGISLKGCRAYVQRFPCSDCAKAIVQAGLSEVVCPAASGTGFDSRWAEDREVSEVILAEGGVTVRFVGEEVV